MIESILSKILGMIAKRITNIIFINVKLILHNISKIVKNILNIVWYILYILKNN